MNAPAPASIPALMRVPPPLMFVATFLIGVGLQRWLPLPMPSPALTDGLRIAGLALLAVGVAFMFTSVGLFLAKRTTLIPFGSASRLVTGGTYRLTRNPMYLGMAVAYLGIAGLFGLAWPVLLLPIPVAVVNTVVIPFEEARLIAIFGQEFEGYCRRTRRWL